MHYAEFGEDEVGPSVVTVAPDRDEGNADNVNMLTPAQSAALLAAIKQYDADKWKVIGAKVGKPAKVSDMWKMLFSLPTLQCRHEADRGHDTGLRAVCERTFCWKDMKISRKQPW